MQTFSSVQNVQNPPQESGRDWVSNFFSAIIVLLGFFIVYTLSMAARRRRGTRPLKLTKPKFARKR
ncbi:MAG: hypothetical protein LBE35_06885 [Clostridiales bacterium]|jgi:hypothetical protein|nr:hypothetical protein [Clostridiales bacterium]